MATGLRNGTTLQTNQLHDGKKLTLCLTLIIAQGLCKYIPRILWLFIWFYGVSTLAGLFYAEASLRIIVYNNIR